MLLTEEPCLYQYFIYMVKDKGKLKTRSISEAQQLWDSICNILTIEKETPRLKEAIKKFSREIYKDKTVKRLVTVESNDGLVLGTQILAHDVLVICIVLNSSKKFTSNVPYKKWNEQLEITTLLEDLKNIYSHATVLQAITNEPEYIANLVKKNVPYYKKGKIASTSFEFGTLWQFGQALKFLFTITKETEDDANKFLANNFAFILTLLSKIDKHYLMAVKFYNDITLQEEHINRFEKKLQRILSSNDLESLENKKNEIRTISKDSTNNVTYLKDCGNNIQSNIINLKDALKDFNFDKENDQIFSVNFELYEEHVQNINSWVNVCESTLMRINKTSGDVQTDLKSQIENLQRKYNGRKIKTKKLKTKKPSREILLEWGNSYIIDESELRKSLALYKKIVKLGIPGLCITRTHPDRFMDELKFEHTSFKWLSKDDCDISVPPVLERLSHTLTDFLKGNENSVVILDGLEYLKTNNDFNKILKFIDHLKDLVFMYKTALILPVYYKIFSEEEIALIKKNMIEITDIDVKFETLKKV